MGEVSSGTTAGPSVGAAGPVVSNHRALGVPESVCLQSGGRGQGSGGS